MTSCSQCTKEYTPKRATSKYCSSVCRKLAFQKVGVSVPENGKISVPVESKNAKNERTCEGVHELDKCLSKEDWKEIKSEILRSPGQMFKICSTNY